MTPALPFAATWELSISYYDQTPRAERLARYTARATGWHFDGLVLAEFSSEPNREVSLYSFNDSSQRLALEHRASGGFYFSQAQHIGMGNEEQFREPLFMARSLTERLTRLSDEERGRAIAQGVLDTGGLMRTQFQLSDGRVTRIELFTSNGRGGERPFLRATYQYEGASSIPSAFAHTLFSIEAPTAATWVEVTGRLLEHRPIPAPEKESIISAAFAGTSELPVGAIHSRAFRETVALQQYETIPEWLKQLRGITSARPAPPPTAAELPAFRRAARLSFASTVAMVLGAIVIGFVLWRKLTPFGR